MLIKAIVENFKSFKNRTELSMITSNKIRGNISHKKNINNINLLKNAVIYGANASGKSNLIEFFRFFKYCVSKELPLSSTDLFCKLDKENENRNSRFQLEFVIDNKFYDYGFEVLLKEREIKAEWLYELKVGGEAVCIYEVEDGKIPTLLMKNVDSDSNIKFKTYAEDYAGTKTSLFLTELNRNKKYSDKSKLLILKKVYEWITRNIIVFSPDSLITDFEYFYNEKSLRAVNKLMSSFDTGISEARIAKITIDELKNRIPQEIFKDVMEKIKETAAEGKDLKSSRFSMRSDDSFFNIEFNEKNEPNITTIKLNHEKSMYEYEFSDESDGTRRLFDLIDMLLIKKDNVVFVVDELERSLHPKLTEKFLTLFNDTHKEKNIQLIFTTHESSIMDQSLFRRDEIWFVERGEHNYSSLYSLDMFKERYDKKLSKNYLEGRYGAIPVFKKFKFEE